MAVRTYKRRGELREATESLVVSLVVEIYEKEQELNALLKQKEDLEKSLVEIEKK